MVIRSDEQLITSAEAARILNVSQKRIQAMMRDHQLKAISINSRQRLITLSSVKKAAIYSGHNGRPYSEQTALSALYVLSGETIPETSAQYRYRIKKLLLNTDADRLICNVRNRASIEEYWATDNNIAALRSVVRESGACPAACTVMQLFPSPLLEGYVCKDDLPRIEREYRLQRDLQPVSVRLHIVRSLPPSTSTHMPLAVCAADIAESSNTREQSAGAHYLRSLLKQYKESIV